MLPRRKAHLLHHPAEQYAKRRHCNNKLHQIAYRKLKNPISNNRIEQQPFNAPPKKEIQRCNIPEVIPGSQCFQAGLDLVHEGLCVRNRMKQFLIFLVGLDCNIKQIAAHKFDTTEVPADPAKIANYFFKLCLTFFGQQLSTHPVCFSQCKILIHLAPP